MVDQEKNNPVAFDQASDVGKTLGYSVITAGEDYQQLVLSTHIYQNHYEANDV